MGVVHAKEKRSNITEVTETKQEISIEGLPGRVDKINIDGLGRTKNDIVQSTVKELFRAKDLQDVVVRIYNVHERLESLGCFRSILVYVDTSKGPNATENGLDVTFYVREQKRFSGGVNTSVGNNEASLLFSMKMPNIAGRGERVQTEFSYGTSKSNNFNVQFIKPIVGAAYATTSASLYQQISDWPWSGYRQLDRGLLLDFGFNSTSLTKHNIQWDASVRELSILSRAASFAVREECGLSLKSSLRHILSMDQRDDLVFPTGGSLLKLTTELAGFGGDIGFLKNEMYLQSNITLFPDLVLQGTLQAGFLRPMTVDKKISLTDQFFLGGPQTLRGFQMRGIGPHSDGNALGSDVYLAGGLHMYGPLPFYLGRGSFGDLFRTHLFVTAGNVGQLSKIKDGDFEQFLIDMKETARLSYGIGLAVRLGQMARIEVNYCFPHSYQKGDQPKPGIQFGVGLQFL